MISRRALIAGAVSGASLSSFAHGQQARRIPRIGVLWHAASPQEESPYFGSLIEGFGSLGYVDGRNIARLYVRQSTEAAPKLGLTTQAFEVAALDRLDEAFDAMLKAGMQGVVVNAESLFYQGKEQIARLAIARRLPTCVWVRELVESGALVSYGVDQRGIARRVAVYVDRILKGEKPAEMPVEQPTKFESIVNMRTAKALGLTVPPAILLRADQVVE